jgi:uncharacterized membrane protein YecN with MAPEG domain
MTHMAIAIVGLYAGLNTLILLWIAIATGQLRAKYKISIGDGGNLHMIRIMRGHANAVENVPMAIILMIIMGFLGAPIYVLHAFGIALTIGRFCHAIHFTKEDAPGWQRAAGASLSMLVLALGALGVIGHTVVLLF